MVSPLSGSEREEHELVVIETSELSLWIKGKPYHERYESLKQYQQLDHNEMMEFYVSGQGVESVHVFDVQQGQLTQSEEYTPLFFENGIYQLVVTSKHGKKLAFHHEHPKLRQAVSLVTRAPQPFLMGNLAFQNEVGFTSFEIYDGSELLLKVKLEIFPSKLSYKDDYRKLLDEVNSEVYNLAYHFVKKTYLGATSTVERQPSQSEFYRLFDAHYRSFLQALERIERQPHHQLMKTHRKARGDQLRRLDSKGRNELRKKPHLFQEVERGIMIKEKNMLPTHGLAIKKELTFDTQENRFVKWMIGRFLHRLADLKRKLTDERGRYKREPDPWLVTRIGQMSTTLERKLSQPFWQGIGKLERSMVSLVMQLAPGYRNAYQIYLIVSRGLSLQGDLYKMSVKDVATLYEYWTFLKLGQILKQKYELLSHDLIKVDRNGLFVNLSEKASAKCKYVHPMTKEKIVLHFQKYESKLPTLSQKPDTMLSIEKQGKDFTYNYIFDAKYRIDFPVNDSKYATPGPLEEDINTMHRYRDALVVESGGSFERNAFGAYVLFPWHDEASYQEHPFFQSIEKVNIGGLPFLPGTTAMVEQLVERLIEKSPEELQAEGILPRGALEEWQSSLEEKVLVGMVPYEQNYKVHLVYKFYHVPVKQLRKGWQEVEYVALYPRKGAAKQNGITCYGKIKDVKVVRRSDIRELPKRSDEEYVRFEVEEWKPLKEVIRPVRYGIRVYAMTTLETLLDAKELPEIFMKSKAEVTLWRMLRRLSNRVQMELDDRYLDTASEIKSYQIKNLTVSVEGGQLLVSNRQVRKTVDLVLLERQPSVVFKELVGMVE
ncbi:DUF2357 domain-containing protein [Anaerobacillus sp. MEB173]|uniref:DUF2357 domain-containing protein n=1 Tax=Anaerobacillus sp. MEB173 TaxID=3383345 RepID=UPI003F8DB538